MTELPFGPVVNDRMEIIAPLIGHRRVLDLGVVDSRPARDATSTRLDKKPNLLFREICRVNPDTLGLDLDAEGIRLLAEQGHKVVAGDVESVDLGEEFDVIVAGEIIEHLNNPGLFLQNMARHLSTDGRLLISTPNPFFAKQRWKIWRYNRPQVHEEHTCWFDPYTLSVLCRRHGFEPESIYWIRKKKLGFKAWSANVRSFFCENFLIVARKKAEG